MKNIQELIKCLNSEDKRLMRKAYRFMEEQKIKKALSPTQWEDLKSQLRGHCEKIKSIFPGEYRTGGRWINEFAVRNMRNGNIFLFLMIPKSPRIHFVNPVEEEGHYAFRVVSDGTAIQMMDGAYPRSAAEIAFRIMKQVTG